MRMAEKKKESAKEAKEYEIQMRKWTKESNLITQRQRKKRKTTKKRNNLNVIEEESNTDEENGSLDGSDDSESEMVVKNDRK